MATCLINSEQIQKFVRNVEYDNLNGCWIWKLSKDTKGYGRIWLFGKYKSTHRLAYEYWKGEIPKELQIDHLCRNRACCNPTHLEAVTAKENWHRGIRKTIKTFLTGKDHPQGKKTHCKWGHEFNEKNTSICLGGRICLTCKRNRMKVIYQRRRL